MWVALLVQMMMRTARHRLSHSLVSWAAISCSSVAWEWNQGNFVLWSPFLAWATVILFLLKYQLSFPMRREKPVRFKGCVFREMFLFQQTARGWSRESLRTKSIFSSSGAETSSKNLKMSVLIAPGSAFELPSTDATSCPHLLPFSPEISLESAVSPSKWTIKKGHVCWISMTWECWEGEYHLETFCGLIKGSSIGCNLSAPTGQENLWLRASVVSPDVWVSCSLLPSHPNPGSASACPRCGLWFLVSECDCSTQRVRPS